MNGEIPTNSLTKLTKKGMKKLFLTAAVALITVAASAQVYLGGEVGFWRNYDANNTLTQIKPEIGYQLNDKWAVGTTLGYLYDYHKLVRRGSVFTVEPYARYTVAKFGPVNVFCDGGAGIASEHVNGAGSFTAWNVGVKPGVAVNLTEKLSFVTHFGFVGYRDADGNHAQTPWGDTGLGAKFSGNELTFGLYWNF